MRKKWLVWVWVGFVGLSPIRSNEVMHEADEFDDDFFYAINREDGFITREDIAEELGWIYLYHLYRDKGLDKSGVTARLVGEHWQIFYKSEHIFSLSKESAGVVVWRGLSGSKLGVNATKRGYIFSKEFAIAIAEVMIRTIYDEDDTGEDDYCADYNEAEEDGYCSSIAKEKQSVRSRGPMSGWLEYSLREAGHVWYVVGSLPKNKTYFDAKRGQWRRDVWFGGVPYIKIRQSDGAILGYMHTR